MTRMWTIYRNPSDYPGQYVVREWAVNEQGQRMASSSPLSIHERLEIVRLAIQYHAPGAVCLARQPEDDPVILETWI